MSEDPKTVPRYEVKARWEHGEKRFVIHDLDRDGAMVSIFDSAHDACVQCTVLWLEHLKTVRRYPSRPVPLTSASSLEHSKAE